MFEIFRTNHRRPGDVDEVRFLLALHWNARSVISPYHLPRSEKFTCNDRNRAYASFRLTRSFCQFRALQSCNVSVPDFVVDALVALEGGGRSRTFPGRIWSGEKARKYFHVRFEMSRDVLRLVREYLQNVAKSRIPIWKYVEIFISVVSYKSMQ